MTDGLQPISDLFGNERYLNPKKGKPLDERASLIKYFHDHARDREGKPFSISYIGYRLSHLKELKDLYYLKSICEQESARGTPWNKVFFGAIKTPLSPPPP